MHVAIQQQLFCFSVLNLNGWEGVGKTCKKILPFGLDGRVGDSSCRVDMGSTTFHRRLSVLKMKSSVSQHYFFVCCSCGDSKHLFLECNSHNEVKITSSQSPSSFILSCFHVQTIHLLRVNPLSRFWMRPLAQLVLISTPKSCLILDTLEERVKSYKDKWENCRNLLTPIADTVDVLWFLILLVL